jgi:aarF domain-containing kinase
MASSGWIRVAIGLQKVAQAAAVQVAENGQEIVTRGIQHGTEMGVSARWAATAAMTIEGPVGAAAAAPPPTAAPSDSTKPQQHVPPRLNVAMEAVTTGFNGLKRNDAQPLHATTTITHDDEASLFDPLSLLPGDNSRILSRHEEHDTNLTASEILPHDAMQEGNGDVSHENVLSHDRLKEGKEVPSSRIGRAFGFASLGLGLAMGTAAEAASRLFGAGSSGSMVANDANADRLAATLCRMRGAALKMGQMLSIQDESLLPPALTKALNQVRQGADAMPKRQLEKQLKSQLGDDWRDRFHSFDDLPFAAASIGQVHRATILEGDQLKDVVVKVQYPGVANSIESDLQNLTMLVKMTGFAPKGLFIDNVIRVGREELKVECDYLREKDHQLRFKKLVESDPVLSRERFVVPNVITDLTTTEVLTTERARGGTIDKVAYLDQAERDRIGRNIFYLTIQELFSWRFMQTDPNWGNFLYDVGSRTTSLIDFGAAREYPKSFVDGYLRIVWCNANRDEETLMELSHKMGFLTGQENDIMLEAHKQSGFTLGEPFATDEAFDFRGSNISSRLSAQSSAFMQHRLTPPPEEVYTLHRKLAGAFMLCIKLGAKVKCRDLLIDVIRNHKFDDGMEPPII